MINKYINAVSKGKKNIRFFSHNGTVNTYMPFWTAYSNSGLPDGVYDKKEALAAIITNVATNPLTADDMPIAPAQLVNPVVIPAQPLYDLLPWACKNDIRYYLNSVLLDRGCIVATNGHVLKKVDTDIFLDSPIIIPRDFLEFAKSMGATELQVAVDYPTSIEDIKRSIMYGPGKVSFSIGNLYAQCNVVDGRFPDYSRVIPDIADLPQQITLPSKKDGAEYLKKAKVLCKYHVIALKNNHININSDGGLVPVSNGIADGIEWTCNAEYFALACADGGILRLSNSTSSGAIFNKNSVSVIMPTRI